MMIGSIELLYITEAFISSFIGFGICWYLVIRLRKASEQKSNEKKLFILSILLFLSPVIAYIFLFLCSFTILNKNICDYFTFGMIISILYHYTYFPRQTKLIKVIIEEITGKRAEIYIESVHITLQELQEKIAIAMNITPHNRIAIESGQGAIVEDLSQQFMSVVNETSITSDPLNGNTIITCYISILDEVIESTDETSPGSPRSVPFYHGLLSNRGEVKYTEETYYLTAKIPFASDAKSFYISAIDKFAAASPFLSSSHMPIRIVPWKDVDDAIQSSKSDNGDYPVSGQHPVDKSPPKSFWRKRLRMPKIQGRTQPTQLVKNGDIVLLQCQDKYINIARGWWLAWNSPIPRRSGAFMIEIIERVPHKKIMETIPGIAKIRRPSMVGSSNTITQGNIAHIAAASQTQSLNPSNLNQSQVGGNTGNSIDDALYTGDTFRLRSLKYPDYEFAITNTRLNEEHCYTGLRKIDDSNRGDDWCIGVHFTFKPNTLKAQIIKKTKI